MALLLAAPALADDLDVRARQVARGLQCPVCQGESVADSQSQLAQEMRALIRKKLEQGETPEQITRYFAERYGESILSAPPKQGATLAVWLMPGAALVVGGAVLWLTLRQWRRAAPLPVAPPPLAPDQEERLRRRLEAELAALDGVAVAPPAGTAPTPNGRRARPAQERRA